MKKQAIVSVLSVVLLIFAFSISAAAVQGTLVGPDGTPLDGFSNVYVIDGQPQPVYCYADGLWYSVFVVGTDEQGNPVCHIGSVTSGEGNGGGGEGKDVNYTAPNETPSCFSGDTLVLMADGSTKMIEDITVGEKVMGYDSATERFTSCVVTSNDAATRSHYYILNGGLKVTAEHPFYAKNFGPTPASLGPTTMTTVQTQALKPYSILYGLNKSNGFSIEKITLNSIIHVTEPGTFYNLQVDGSEAFFVSPDGELFAIVAPK